MSSLSPPRWRPSGLGTPSVASHQAAPRLCSASPGRSAPRSCAHRAGSGSSARPPIILWKAEANPSDPLPFERDQWDPTPRLLRVSAERGIGGHRQLPQPLALRALGHHGHGPERLLAYLHAHLRMGEQVVVPGGVLRRAARGGEDDRATPIFHVHKRGRVRPAALGTRRCEQQDGEVFEEAPQVPNLALVGSELSDDLLVVGFSLHRAMPPASDATVFFVRERSYDHQGEDTHSIAVHNGDSMGCARMMALGDNRQKAILLSVATAMRCRVMSRADPTIRTSPNAVTHELELRRIYLPRTPVNKARSRVGAPADEIEAASLCL